MFRSAQTLCTAGGGSTWVHRGTAEMIMAVMGLPLQSLHICIQLPLLWADALAAWTWCMALTGG